MENKRHLNILIFTLIMLTNNLNFNSAADNENLYEALNLVVQKSFVNKTKPLVFYANFNKKFSEHYFAANDLINKVLLHISNATYKVLYNRQKIFFNIKHNDVILLENVKTFRYFFSKMRYIGNKDLAFTVLFISSLKTLDFETIYLIFKDLYYMQIIRVALVIRLANDDIVMLTYFPFTHKACRDFKPVVINRYLPDRNRWENDKYFPSKLKNFFGCPLYCCTWKEMPYFDVKLNKKNSNITDYVGLDASILKYAASSLNFSIKIQWIDSIRKYTDTRETLLSQLFTKGCDLALGGFTYEQEFYNTTVFSQTRFFLFSPIYIVTNIINFHTAYEKLALPFQCTVWFALGLTFALSFLLIYICGQQRQRTGYRHFIIGSTNNAPYFNLFATAVGDNMTRTHMPKRNFARFLLTCWLLFTFIHRTAYQSGMYQMLRDNKQWNPPQTIADVFQQNYLISLTPENRKYLEILPDAKRVQIVNSTVLDAFTDMLNAKVPKAFIVPYEYFGYFGLKNISQWRNMHLVRERLLTQQLTIYARHHSYLIPVLNPMISHAQFNGFLTIWSRKNILPLESALKFTAEAERNNNRNSDKNGLSMHELGAILMILVWLHVLASAVFLIEVIWHRCGDAIKNFLYCRK